MLFNAKVYADYAQIDTSEASLHVLALQISHMQCKISQQSAANVLEWQSMLTIKYSLAFNAKNKKDIVHDNESYNAL